MLLVVYTAEEGALLLIVNAYGACHSAATSSWLNMIERWFAEITNKRIRRESWRSIEELEEAIIDYITSWNKSGRKFCWTKTFNEIQMSIKKVKTAL